MKRKIEIKPKPGGEITFGDLIKVIDQVRQEVPTNGKVTATVRFNGTLRGLAVEWDDEITGDAGSARTV